MMTKPIGWLAYVTFAHRHNTGSPSGGAFLKALHFLHLYNEFLALFCRGDWVQNVTLSYRSEESGHVHCKTYDMRNVAG